jgi:predicted dehydrogenase
MKAGRHVCTEVPAAYTLDQCWNLVNTVKKTGCKYQLMEQTRYWGFVDVWKGMRDRGELGHVCLAQGEYIHYERWDTWMDADTGKIFYDIKPPAGKNIVPTWRNRMLCNPIYYLPHTLSPLLKILDDRVLRVSCMGTRKGSYTYPDEVLGWSDLQYALMHTAGDTVMLVGAGFSMPNINRGQTYSHWYELRGNKGNVTSPRSKTDNFQKWQIGMDTFEVMNLSTVPLDANASQADSGHGGADFKPVDTFLQAILNDTTPPMDVYLTAEMTAPAIIAAESARRNGEAMDVPDFRAGKKTAASSRKRRPKKGNVS